MSSVTEPGIERLIDSVDLASVRRLADAYPEHMTTAQFIRSAQITLRVLADYIERLESDDAYRHNEAEHGGEYVPQRIPDEDYA